MNSIIKKITLVFIFILPFVFLSASRFPAVFPKSLFIELVILLMGAIWIIGRLYEKRKEENKIKRNLMLLSFFVYILILVISCFHSIVPHLSFWGTLDRGLGVIFILHLFLFSIIVGSVFKTQEDWNKLFTSFIFSGIFFTIGSILTQFGIKLFYPSGVNAIKGFTFGNSSFAGIYLVFLFFISLGIFLASENNIKRIIGVCGILAVVLNPIITGIVFPGGKLIGEARASFVSIILGLVLFSLYLIFRKIKSKKGIVIFITGLSLIFISSMSFLYFNNFPYKEFMIKNGASNRLIFWDIAIKGFKEKPILGWGNDAYHLVYGKYFDPIITKSPDYSPEYWIDRSHNIFFDELVSNGILGFLALIFLYSTLLFGLVRKAIKEKNNKIGMLFMAIFVGIIAFIIQGMMLFQVIIGWFIIAILVSFASVFCFDDKNYFNKINISILRKYKLSISILIAVIFCFSFVYFFVKPLSFAINLTKMLNSNSQGRIEIYHKINNAYVGDTADLGDVFLSFFKDFRAGIAKTDLSPNILKSVKSEIKEINNTLDIAFKKQKYMDVKVLMAQIEFISLASILSEGTDEQKIYYDKGMEYVKKMSEISPQNPLIKNAEGIMKFSIE